MFGGHLPQAVVPELASIIQKVHDTEARHCPIPASKYTREGLASIGSKDGEMMTSLPGSPESLNSLWASLTDRIDRKSVDMRLIQVLEKKVAVLANIFPIINIFLLAVNLLNSLIYFIIITYNVKRLFGCLCMK